jgi:uncharacterized protein YbjT (DUF2867 family)
MIFITGSTGFVGKEIVKRFMQKGEKVLLLVRNDSSIPFQVEKIKGDVLDNKSLVEGMKKCNKVVHLVGIIRETKGQTFEKIHVQGTQNVVKAAKECGISKIVHMSALGTRENAKSRYHKTKWEAEEIVRSSGIPYVIFRPSIIVGKEDKFVNLFVSMIKGMPGKLGILPVVGKGKNKFQPIGVEDVADCFVKACLDEKIVNKTYVLAGDEVFTYNALLDCLMQVLGVQKRKLHFPISLMRILAFCFDWLPFFPLTRDQLLMLEEDNIGENEAMKRDFDMTPRKFEEILRSYLP